MDNNNPGKGESEAQPEPRRSFSTLRSRLSSKKFTKTLDERGKGDAYDSQTSRVLSDDSEQALPTSPTSMTGRKGTHKRNASSRSQIASMSGTAAPPADSQIYADSPPPLPPKSPVETLSNPLATQVPRIVKYFFLSSLALLLVSRFVHWSLGIVLAATLSFVLNKQLQSASEDAEWQKDERMRNIASNDESSQGETVEWMNVVLKTIWPLITQDYFVPFVDLLEDALMQQVPPIVHSCRVEDLDQGSVPLRVQSFTILDSHEDAFTRGTTEVQRLNVKTQESGTDTEDEEHPDVGDFVNLEITFAYRSPAARGKKKKSNKAAGVVEDQASLEKKEGQVMEDSDLPVDQIHLLIYMAIGLQKLAAVEVPVWCEMLGIEGRMRLRLQLVPAAPFVNHVAFCFVGLPKLEISAKPLGRRMVIDAMHLPLISSYVLHSVEAVIKDFIAPKSYTVNVAGLLGAGDGPSNVYALGVIVLVIHQGIQLPAADANGLCDPFVSVSFARAGKTLFTTRIIVKSRNAIWQEMAVLLVSEDEVRDHEKLRMTVYDADRFSADDPLGKVDVSIDKLIHRALRDPESETPGQSTFLESRIDDLQPMRKGGQPVKGQLKYSVGFYRLARPLEGLRSPGKQEMLRKAAQRRSEDSRAKIAVNEKDLPDVPSEGNTKREEEGGEEIHDELMAVTTPFDRFVHKLGLPLDPDVLRRRKERKERVQKLVSMLQSEEQATFGAPHVEEFPSGILAFHIHSIDSLGFAGPQKSLSSSKRLSQKPQYTGDEEVTGEGSTKMPSSYVQVLLNDEAIFRSRTKTLNPRPYINAGSERFVLDFKQARIDFVVRDARQRENDPILGVAGLKLSDILVKTSRLTQWYTLTGGLGWGKIRITLLWRSAEVKIPKELQGWNVGVIEVTQCAVSGIAKSYFERKEAHMMFETVGGRAETDSIEPFDEYESGKGEEATIGFQWQLKEPVRVAVRQRYPNFLYIHLRSDSRVPGRSHKHAHTVISLARMKDDVEITRKVPVFETNDWQRFEQDILRGITTTACGGTGNVASTPKNASSKDLQAPVLDQLCDTSQAEYSDLPEDVKSDGHIKKIGYATITLVFHPGVSLEHKSLIPGDSEMRIAYDSFLTLMDAGERPRPKTGTTARRRKVSSSGGSVSQQERPRPSEDASRLRSLDGGNRAALAQGGGTSTPGSQQGGDEQRYSNEDVGEDGAEYDDDDDDDASDIVTPDGRRARARNMHRQHRGAAQVKGFRTLEWIKTNVEDGMGHVKRTAQQQRSKRIAKMENEGVSHF